METMIDIDLQLKNRKHIPIKKSFNNISKADFPLLLIPVITLMTGLSTKGLILDMYKGRSFILIFLTIANIHFLGL